MRETLARIEYNKAIKEKFSKQNDNGPISATLLILMFMGFMCTLNILPEWIWIFNAGLCASMNWGI